MRTNVIVVTVAEGEMVLDPDTLRWSGYNSKEANRRFNFVIGEGDIPYRIASAAAASYLGTVEDFRKPPNPSDTH